MCFLWKQTKDQVYNELEIKTRQVSQLEIILSEKENELEEVTHQYDIEKVYYETVIEELKIRVEKLEMETFRDEKSLLWRLLHIFKA